MMTAPEIYWASDPHVVAQIWASRPLTDVCNPPETPDWADPFDRGLSVHDPLKQDGIRSIITMYVASILGSIGLIKVMIMSLTSLC